jgi:hypothetical protein
MNRRDFFRSALAVSAIAAVPLIASERAPVVYGDGIHDDTAGLQAALSGKPFVSNGHLRTYANRLVLDGGTYRLSETLKISRSNTLITNASFAYFEPVEYCVQINNCSHVRIDTCSFECLK